MIKHRKFNAEGFFAGFREHEEELHALLAKHGVPTPDPMDLGSIYAALLEFSGGSGESLVACLHELNDLSSRTGREVLEQTCVAMDVDIPAEDVCNPRAACLAYLNTPHVFEHAMELLAVRSIQASKVAIFPGRAAAGIGDGPAVVERLTELLQEPLRSLKNTDAFEVRHYFDGDMFVAVVFCERNAEVQLEFGSHQRRVMSRVRRPADQHVILFNQASGQLEIEGARAKERNILRECFAEAAFNDSSFFPENENSQLLSLDRLIETEFNLPTRPGHTARLTGLRLIGAHNRKKVSFDFRSGRNDVVDIMAQRQILGTPIAGMSVHSARIELVLEPTRAGRKSIELSGANSIMFNRTSFAGVVSDYLSDWGLMNNGMASENLV